jgi:hypothetical protein
VSCATLGLVVPKLQFIIGLCEKPKKGSGKQFAGTLSERRRRKSKTMTEYVSRDVTLVNGIKKLDAEIFIA